MAPLDAEAASQCPQRGDGNGFPISQKGINKDSIHPSIHPIIHVSMYLSICLSIYSQGGPCLLLYQCFQVQNIVFLLLTVTSRSEAARLH